MRRGDIVSVAAQTAFGSKPRPSLILQSDYFEPLRTATLIGFTSQFDDALDMRIAVEPSQLNQLRVTFYAMVDAVTTVRREDLGTIIGHIDASDLERIERATLIFLGFHG
ncbi:MAG: type II toxin-antitoxin system PemK/MazF family toxin [Sphingomonadaceae bacterium]